MKFKEITEANDAWLSCTCWANWIRALNMDGYIKNYAKALKDPMCEAAEAVLVKMSRRERQVLGYGERESMREYKLIIDRYNFKKIDSYVMNTLCSPSDYSTGASEAGARAKR